MAAAPQFVATPNVQATTFATADGTSTKAIFTAFSTGSRVMMLAVTGNNGVALDVNLLLTIGGSSYELAQVTLPAASGAAKFTSISLLDPDLIVWLDRQEPSLVLPSGYALSMSLSAAVDSGRKIDVTVFGGNF